MQITHLPKIVIDTVPHKKQRYPTSGDYYKKNGNLNIRVSRMNRDHEFLIAFHELIEWYLIDKKGVTIQEIDEFDMMYEKNRKKGDDSEPGDDRNAPYYKEHQFASFMEKEMAKYLGVSWKEYSEHVSKL